MHFFGRFGFAGSPPPFQTNKPKQPSVHVINYVAPAQVILRHVHHNMNQRASPTQSHQDQLAREVRTQPLLTAPGASVPPYDVPAPAAPYGYSQMVGPPGSPKQREHDKMSTAREARDAWHPCSNSSFFFTPVETVNNPQLGAVPFGL